MRLILDSLVLCLVIFISKLAVTVNTSYSICNYSSCECREILGEIYVKCSFDNREVRAINSLLQQNRSVNQNNETIIYSLKIQSKMSPLGLVPNGLIEKYWVGKLFAGNLGLVELDPNLFKGVLGIKYLDLNSNNLSKIDFSTFPFGATDYLEWIELAHNRLTSMPRFNSSRLPKIHTINLSFNEIENSTAFDYDLPSLQILDLSHNFITSFDFDKFSLLVRRVVRDINLSSNRIRKIGRLGSFPNLFYFSMSQNKILELESDTFDDVPFLERLDLSKNHLVQLPVDVFKYMVNLQVLNLAHNHLNEIKSCAFENLGELIQLELQHNKLKQVNLEWFANLAKLMLLDLSYNHLETFQMDSNIQLKKLDVLRLTANRLKFIDEPKRYFPRLNNLELARNNLTRIPYNLTNVVKLNVSNNGVLIIPNFLITRSKSSHINLLIIDLSYNHLVVSSSKSFCIRDDSISQLASASNTDTNRPDVYNQYLDLKLSETTLANISRCTFKNLSEFFRRVRVFVAQEKKSHDTIGHEICKCEVRLFLSSVNILIKDCPPYSTYCAGRTSYPPDDCPSDPCTK